MTQLDFELPLLTYFTVGTITCNENTWSLTLTRTAGSSGYGQYTVTFNQDGFDPGSTIPADVSPMETPSSSSSSSSSPVPLRRVARELGQRSGSPEFVLGDPNIL